MPKPTAHAVVFASAGYIECDCGNISMTRMGRESHLYAVGQAPFNPARDADE